MAMREGESYTALCPTCFYEHDATSKKAADDLWRNWTKRLKGKSKEDRKRIVQLLKAEAKVLRSNNPGEPDSEWVGGFDAALSLALECIRKAK